MDVWTWLMVGTGLLLAGMVLGVVLYALWLRRRATAMLRVPGKWPLGPRGLVTTHEYDVWSWLRATFHDHIVMVKIPVQRFTTPLDTEKGRVHGERWLELLSGVYTTFTVCTTDGRVIGCVDVPSKRGLSHDNFEFKETLLWDCGISYTVVRGTHLPSSGAMRAAFLGEAPAEEAPAQARLAETRRGDTPFHAELAAFTKEKVRAAKEAAMKELNKDNHQVSPASRGGNVGFNATGTGSIKTADQRDRFAADWEDSFMYPSDTRPARLD